MRDLVFARPKASEHPFPWEVATLIQCLLYLRLDQEGSDWTCWLHESRRAVAPQHAVRHEGDLDGNRVILAVFDERSRSGVELFYRLRRCGWLAPAGNVAQAEGALGG